jgi:hypothetical protein
MLSLRIIGWVLIAIGACSLAFNSPQKASALMMVSFLFVISGVRLATKDHGTGRK